MLATPLAPLVLLLFAFARERSIELLHEVRNGELGTTFLFNIPIFNRFPIGPGPYLFFGNTVTIDTTPQRTQIPTPKDIEGGKEVKFMIEVVDTELRGTNRTAGFISLVLGVVWRAKDIAAMARFLNLGDKSRRIHWGDIREITPERHEVERFFVSPLLEIITEHVRFTTSEDWGLQKVLGVSAPSASPTETHPSDRFQFLTDDQKRVILDRVNAVVLSKTGAKVTNFFIERVTFDKELMDLYTARLKELTERAEQTTNQETQEQLRERILKMLGYGEGSKKQPSGFQDLLVTAFMLINQIKENKVDTTTVFKMLTAARLTETVTEQLVAILQGISKLMGKDFSPLIEIIKKKTPKPEED